MILAMAGTWASTHRMAKQGCSPKVCCLSARTSEVELTDTKQSIRPQLHGQITYPFLARRVPFPLLPVRQVNAPRAIISMGRNLCLLLNKPSQQRRRRRQCRQRRQRKQLKLLVLRHPPNTPAPQ